MGIFPQWLLPIQMMVRGISWKSDHLHGCSQQLPRSSHPSVSIMTREGICLSCLSALSVCESACERSVPHWYFIRGTLRRRFATVRWSWENGLTVRVSRENITTESSSLLPASISGTRVSFRSCILDFSPSPTDSYVPIESDTSMSQSVRIFSSFPSGCIQTSNSSTHPISHDMSATNALALRYVCVQVEMWGNCIFTSRLYRFFRVDKFFTLLLEFLRFSIAWDSWNECFYGSSINTNAIFPLIIVSGRDLSNILLTVDLPPRVLCMRRKRSKKKESLLALLWVLFESFAVIHGVGEDMIL